MKKPYLIVIALLFALAVRTVSADVVETKSGARIVGKVTQIDGSTVVVDTDYAGTIKIKQGDVTSITTDNPANIRLASGTVLQGTLAGTSTGGLVIAGPDGSIQTSVDKVVTTWAPAAASDFTSLGRSSKSTRLRHLKGMRAFSACTRSPKRSSQPGFNPRISSANQT